MRWERETWGGAHWATSGQKRIGYVTQLRCDGPFGSAGRWIWRLSDGQEGDKSYVQRKVAERALERAWAVWLSDRGLVDALARADA